MRKKSDAGTVRGLHQRYFLRDGRCPGHWAGVAKRRFTREPESFICVGFLDKLF